MFGTVGTWEGAEVPSHERFAMNIQCVGVCMRSEDDRHCLSCASDAQREILKSAPSPQHAPPRAQPDKSASVGDAVYFTALAIDDIFISSFVCHSHAATRLARELAEWISAELNPEGYACLVPAADEF